MTNAWAAPSISPWPAMVLSFLVSIGAFSTPPPSRLKTPKPLPAHPGNIFIRGEPVVVDVPSSQGNWSLHDYEDRELREIVPIEGKLRLENLVAGFYRLRPGGAKSNWVSLAVVEPLQAPTPATSPIALDVAMAWFYQKEQMPAAASLCALAGVNWVRDRLNWSDMESRRGEFANANQYDTSATAQSEAGLQVLQVNHRSPRWANPDGKRFPIDLRDAYQFYRQMAARWSGRVTAFEPWNEADIPMFGGHTGSEMASLQKASWLGLKAGSRDVIACLNVFATHRKAELDEFAANEPWAYFDTFNLHHYEPLDRYPAVYADFRAVSGGKPLWVTECAVPVKWTGNPKLQEPSEADLRLQSERIGKVFACSLHEGTKACFYFLLPHYVEGQTQFGLLRRDLTPRPGFVALAAVGRLLADAHPLGKLAVPATTSAYLFTTQTDGQPHEVIVAWAQSGTNDLPLPITAEAVFDHLGRRVTAQSSFFRCTTAPIFIVCPRGTSTKLALIKPPKLAPLVEEVPSTVVFQSVFPAARTSWQHSLYRLSANSVEPLTLQIYNFGTSPVQGRLKATTPKKWRTDFPSGMIRLQPMERKEITVQVDCRKAFSPIPPIQNVRFTGEFGPAGQPVLSIRLLPEPFRFDPEKAIRIVDSDKPTRWQGRAANGRTVKRSRTDNGCLFEVELAPEDRWIYPLLTLTQDEHATKRCHGLAMAITLLEGKGDFKVIFDEETGGSYTADLLIQPRIGECVETVALLDEATFGGGWSAPDPNGRFDPEQVHFIKLGASEVQGRVRFAVKDLRWIKE